MNKEALVEQAIIARGKSYSPYSKFAVGAAILTKDGKVFHGANIENAAYGLCLCAERNAIFHAMLNGYKKDDFVSMAVVANTEAPVSPCGSCRQVMSELVPAQTPIILANLHGAVKEVTVAELLPYSFDDRDF